MAKTKKPAQKKGGAKKCAPKKAAKKPAKKLTERQADQLNADKMRADAFASTQSVRQAVEASRNFSANVSQLAAACFEGVDVKPKKKSIWHRFRSAITGLFVSKKHAEANPNTTVRERVK